MRRGLYRLGPITRGVRSLLNAAAPRGLTEVEIAAGPLAGARLQLDLQTEKDLWLGTFELELLRTLRDFVRPGTVVYDVGANLGYLSLALARAVGASGQVVAFEPLPDNFSRLQANLRLNREGDRIRAVEAAVGVRSTRSRFFSHTSGGMGKLEGSSGRRFEYADSLEVQVICLDDWVYRNGEAAPALVKIDVEGGEALALEGMARLLREARPQVLVELHGPEATESARQQLLAANYRLHSMEPGYPEWQPGPWKDQLIGIPPTA
jgi:FkbM family methyltransferase